MTLRLATAGDGPVIEAFLARHPETSMFLRANLAAHGIGVSDHPHATTFWLSESLDALTGVYGRTNNGALLVQAPHAGPDDWRCWVEVLKGQSISVFTGDDQQVRAALAALKLRQGDFALNHAEPLYRLGLNRVDAPAGQLRRARADDVDLLTDWFTAYLLDTGLTTDHDSARADATKRAADAPRDGNPVRLLDDGDGPVAMAALNAIVADIVQVGGVYVPRDHRSRGLGRRVTAALLADARDAGAGTAILFANNAAAARAYEAIGFDRIGAYRVAVLKMPIELETTA